MRKQGMLVLDALDNHLTLDARPVIHARNITLRTYLKG
jgi:hypothetical protein